MSLLLCPFPIQPSGELRGDFNSDWLAYEGHGTCQNTCLHEKWFNHLTVSWWVLISLSFCWERCVFSYSWWRNGSRSCSEQHCEENCGLCLSHMQTSEHDAPEDAVTWWLAPLGPLLLGQRRSAKLPWVRGEQHNEATSLLSYHCTFLRKKKKLPSFWESVFPPCLQRLGSSLLVKCSQLEPPGRKFSCLQYNSFCLVSSAVIRQSSSVYPLPLTSLIISR